MLCVLIAESGSSSCEDKKACTVDDYFDYNSPCDSDGQVSLVYNQCLPVYYKGYSIFKCGGGGGGPKIFGTPPPYLEFHRPSYTTFQSLLTHIWVMCVQGSKWNLKNMENLILSV